MYPWDARAEGPRSRPPAPRDSDDSTPVDPATAAVQVALDRRDNGGDANEITPSAAARGRK
jgi:hypothetical protein